jgi:predicted alpha/beta-hydrolase family hydrolase
MREHVSTPPGDVSLILDGPKDPSEIVVLGHGAGAPMESDFMDFFAQALATDRRAVARFNFVYMEQGRRSPGSPKASEETFTAVVDHLRSKLEPGKILIGGKSYGGRMASHIAAGGVEVDGLVFLGYPLHAPGRPENIRAAHLSEITAPMLFVEGTRDPFCPLETLRGVLQNLSAPTELIVVEDGDHSLKVRKSSGRDTEQAWGEAAAGISEWLER